MTKPHTDFLPTGPFVESFLEAMQPEPPTPEPPPETVQARLRREIAELNVKKEQALQEARDWISRQAWAQPQKETE